MNLRYSLTQAQEAALALAPDEAVWYCVPVDLSYDNARRQAGEAYADNRWLVVTPLRFVVLESDRISAAFPLADCAKIKCETQVSSGIVTVTGKDGSVTCAARFSMRHITRVSYLVRGAQTMIQAMEKGSAPDSAERIVSKEFEKYCDKCGRALPGTSRCPYCSGSSDIFRRFFTICEGYVKEFVLLSLLMVVIAIVGIANPAVQRHFIDNVLASGNGTWRDLLIFVILTFSISAAWVGLEVLRTWNCVKLATSLSMSLRRRLYYKIQALSLSFINKRKPGELINRVTKDSQRISEFVNEVFGEMITTLLTMFVSLVMMFIINWKMTLLALVFVVIVFLIIDAYWHYIHVIFSKQWRKHDEVSSSLQDILSGMRVVKSFGMEEREASRFTQKTREFAVLQKRNETFWAVFFPIMTFLLGCGSYIAVYFGGADVLGDRISLGELNQYIAYSGYLFGPLSWMTYLPRAFMQMITSLNRIYDVLDEEPAIVDKTDAKAFPIEGAFSFREVGFGYQSYEPVLENVSFEVAPGEMIGLVGASGTGKSTLINLIMRLYDVDQGSISIDGVDLRDIKTESLHSQIGVVLQETFLFSGSILANIRFAKQDASLEEVIRAAKAANAHDFICKTPDGYNTYVGEHGYNLSGGERQRIAIARAILNNPRILILDEATSALDTESEFLIQQALDRLVRGRTTFAIAHRLSTLRSADRLIVIDRHSIAEIGTHNELLEKKGIYYNLVTAQLAMAEGK